MDAIHDFRAERERLNAIVLKYGQKTIKRFFNLDTNVYADGALPAKTKELLGLVASLVLRCDDCILYHVLRCAEEGVTDEEFEEALSIGLIVGGSITIPHLRRAFGHWEEISQTRDTPSFSADDAPPE
ncbi:carboxymuconolactone decarboxylase family protein [candidate division KSB3 bacterium]|jgi:AhpD family alkylhydroperoxidase|uniref:Carboxymuconolactone decarboxylase family protein n=1 Tax=candidate division KSB3 bacterium TaxID=2044937 RepID=A0A9D5JUZ5_9BACT|nr:carboxymuconolactone decarboxylase family protein [candidate division KSB3 bacterium]MBD3324752.1 carboxymuconolactone decarboxylase family protein [candidate division KSB3 bacterium]